MNAKPDAGSDADLGDDEHDGPSSVQDKAQRRAGEVDAYVGQRIRERRLMLGLSQTELANQIGITYQQAHKYERGLNRISAGRLAILAKVLHISPEWFFEGFGNPAVVLVPHKRQRQLLELMRNFEAIQSDVHREAVASLAKALAAESGAPAASPS